MVHRLSRVIFVLKIPSLFLDMTSILRYIIKDLDEEELESYKAYLRGDSKSTKWIEKCSKRRDDILVLNEKCDVCDSFVSCNEKGKLRCQCGPCNVSIYEKIMNRLI